uniref:OSIGBa0135A16.2 protein n=1 Tax=Oryza sativa TaxID=4530 RepID=Q01LV6_ORYSA|nr:OSIGBa0135A16.2 [Oryza sativa]
MTPLLLSSQDRIVTSYTQALPLTDVIGPLADHQAAASLKEGVAKEASDIAFAAATTSGSNVPKRGRKFSSMLGTRRKAPAPSPDFMKITEILHWAARAKAAQDGFGATSSASPAAASTDVVVVPRDREATPSGPAGGLVPTRGPPADVLTLGELQAEMECILQAGARGIGREIEEARAAAAASANERADKLACDLAEVREDLQKMRELVVGNERQRQGLEHRMSELENNLSEIRGSLRVTYTGLHQLARECGVTTTIPANPDEFSLTSSLAELATAMEEIPSKHAARIGEETSNGIYTGACHILMCVRLTHPDLDLRRILDQGAANDTHKGVIEEVGDLGESILPLFQEDVDVEDVQQRGKPETSVIVPALVLKPYVPQDDVDQRLSVGADMAMTPRERVGRSRSSNPVLKDEVRGGRTREDYGGSEEGAGRGSSPRSRRCGSTRTSRVAARRWLKSTGSSEYLTGIPRSRRPDTSMKVH